MLRELVVLCVLGLAAGVAVAQPRVGPTQSRPAVSPYLNLLRPGNSTALNYYGLVKPQLEFRSGIDSLQQQVTGNEAVIADINSAVVPSTGHTTTFLNTGGYFSGGPGRTNRAGGGGTRFGVGGQTANRQQPAPQTPRR